MWRRCVDNMKTGFVIFIIVVVLCFVKIIPRDTGIRCVTTPCPATKNVSIADIAKEKFNATSSNATSHQQAIQNEME